MPFRLDTAIDWDSLSRAISAYEREGYSYIEVPWAVTMEAINVTRPPSAKVFQSGSGYLVGSAEQSFIQLMMDGVLKEGKYMAVTPCFRDEHDDLHSPYFVKLELIDIGASDEFDIIHSANRVFNNLDKLRKLAIFNIQQTDEGYDLVGRESRIEVGSYGIRTYKNFRWAYGTGLALPRYSKVLEIENVALKH